MKFLNAAQSAKASLQFAQLHQVHGVCIHQRDPKNQTQILEGDGHWTLEPDLPLVIRTADCLPILGHCRRTGLVFALHAGWRGLHQNILAAFFGSCPRASASDCEISIGPHIQSKSFEFDEKPGLTWLNEVFGGNADRVQKCFYFAGPGKIKITLSRVLYEQALDLGLAAKHIHISAIDTFEDLSYYSYRREQQTHGRNLSYVEILSTDQP